MLIIDFWDDMGASLDLFDEQVPGKEEFLKIASTSSPHDSALLDRDFALILVDAEGKKHRKYACADPAGILVSASYLSHYHGNLNRPAAKIAASTLLDLASTFGVEDLLPEGLAKLASIELTPLEEGDIRDAREVRYRAPTRKKEASTKRASVYDAISAVRNEWHDLSYAERREASVKLASLVEDFPEGTIPAFVEDYAGESVGDRFPHHMRVRAASCRDEKIAAQYNKLASAYSLFSADRLVELVGELDSLAGFRYVGGDRYGEKIADVYKAVYSKSKAPPEIWSHGADFVSDAQLKSFPQETGAKQSFTKVFPETTWYAFVKDPCAVFRSMPVEQKILVSRMARQSVE